jgi:uncharacterized membrane protein YphA (DoxX/SURF4 family)
MRLGVIIFGLGALATGVMDLLWGAFDPSHQPIQAWGDHVPGSGALAYIVGALLVVGGTAVTITRSRSLGGAILMLVYLLFAAFWLPRLYTAPLVLGVHPGVYIGVLGGICQQLIVVCAAYVTYTWAKPSNVSHTPSPVVRWAFGLSSIDFGLQHLTNLHSLENVAMVPTWMPFGSTFWIVLTGVAFLLAGIAILIGTADVLAARLLAAMLLVFSVVTLIPILLAAPHDEGNWGGNMYEIVAAASAWILAEALATTRGWTKPAAVADS